MSQAVFKVRTISLRADEHQQYLAGGLLHACLIGYGLAALFNVDYSQGLR
jgi:hypothetical protein